SDPERALRARRGGAVLPCAPLVAHEPTPAAQAHRRQRHGQRGLCGVRGHGATRARRGPGSARHGAHGHRRRGGRDRARRRPAAAAPGPTRPVRAARGRRPRRRRRARRGRAMSLELARTVVPGLVAAPLLGAALAFLVGRRHAARVAAVTVVVVALATAALLWVVWREGSVRVAVGGWSPPLGIGLVADGLSAVLIATTTVVCAAITLYAGRFTALQLQADPRAIWMFWPLWLCLWAGMNAALLSGDLFNLYVTIEVIGLSAVSLVALSGAAALAAAARYLLVTLSGSLFYLMGVGLLYADYGVVDIAMLGRIVQAQPATQAALVLMTLGLALKTAIVPLHFWLAPAHGGALGPISAVLSSLLVKSTFYVLLRL